MVNHEVLDDGVLKGQNVDRVTSVEKFEDRSWDRDNISQRVNEIRSNHETIETILQDINEQLNNIPNEEQLRDDWSGFLDNVQTDNRGKAKYFPRAFYEAESRRSQLLLRQAIWQARLKELESFARRKLASSFESLLSEYRTLKSKEDLSDVFDVKGEMAKLESLINQVEKLGQAMREERRTDRKTIETLASSVEGVDEDKLSHLVESSAENGLEQFVKSNGVFTLDQDELNQDAKESDRLKTAERVAEESVSDSDNQSSSDSNYSLKGKSFDEKVDVLVKLWNEENIHERIDDPDDDITKSEVAEMVDVAQPTLFNQGLFDRIEDEKEVFLRKP